MTYRFFILPLALLCSGPVFAQTAAPVAFQRYLEAVEQHSLDLAAQRENVTSAKAGISIAGLRPDPNLSLGYGPKEFGKEVDPKPPIATSVGLEWTIETGGKRQKRIQAANSNVRLAEANVEGFKHQLYNTAATAYVETCRTRQVLVRLESSLTALSAVVQANETRRKAGDVSGLELLQSRTERDQFQASVVKARADAKAAFINLSVPLGRRFADQFGGGEPDCTFAPFEAGTDIDVLIAEAQKESDDVQIARATLDNARDGAELARANRSVDPTVSLTYSQTPRGRSSLDGNGDNVAGTPPSRTLSVGLSIPIPFSRLQKGEIIQAESVVTQALLTLRSVELKTEADVRTSYSQFVAASENLRRYRESVIEDAAKVLDGMRLSYRSGSASLLELLAAQRSADDAYVAYLQAQADAATAAVQLELSIGRRPSL